MKQAYDLIKFQNEGTEPPGEKTTKTFGVQLDELLARSNDKTGPSAPQRDIYEEEQNKIDEWNDKMKAQDQILGDVRNDIRQLNREAQNIGDKQNELAAKIDQTRKMADKTDKKLTETRGKLHDLLEKYKSADRFCIDIVLICICLGLIAVLYNLVKNKFFGNNSSSSNTTTKLFLYY